MHEADWEREAARADVIHHCGAEVNFLYPYEKLRAANVFGTQEVLRLAARRAIPVHHVSTMSVVHGMGVAGVQRVTEDTGNETTKNATTGGLVAFSRNPDRRHLLRRQPELLDSAVEEILRYTSVIQHVTRTFLRPQTLAGTGLYPGDLLCVWVASANRDEEVFTEPDTFRIDCDPNPHLAFTAGKHFCLGASLSRLELRPVFESLLTRVESIHLFGFPIRKPTNLILAYASVPGRTTGWLIQAKGG